MLSVEMTREEAERFNATLNKAYNNLQIGASYVGGCSIDLDSPSTTEYPKIVHTCKDCGEQWELNYDENCDKCSYRDGKNNCVSCNTKCEEDMCPNCSSINWEYSTGMVDTKQKLFEIDCTRRGCGYWLSCWRYLKNKCNDCRISIEDKERYSEKIDKILREESSKCTINELNKLWEQENN